MESTGEVPTDPSRRGGAAAQIFATTHWSVVLAAGGSEAPQATEALGRLFKQYWFPLYSYTRRRGYDHHQAEDLTQAFFHRLIDRSILRGVAREKGKFRAFLLTALGNFLNDEWDRSVTAKRGGGQTPLSLSSPEDDPDRRFPAEPADPSSPEKLFTQQWVATLVEQVLVRLASEMSSAGKAGQFEALRQYLTGEKGLPPYSQVAVGLEMTEGAVKVAIHRLRQRYGELFREQILQTVASPQDLEEEIRELLVILGQ